MIISIHGIRLLLVNLHTDVPSLSTLYLVQLGGHHGVHPHHTLQVWPLHLALNRKVSVLWFIGCLGIGRGEVEYGQVQEAWNGGFNTCLRSYQVESSECVLARCYFK